jgi:hypothetical protein
MLVTVAPGADMALVTGQVLVGGTGLAQRTILGNLRGLVVPWCRPRRRAVGTAGVGGRLHRGELAGAGYLLYCSDGSSDGLSAPLPPETHQIRSLVLSVDLVGSRRIGPAHVGRVVDPDRSRRIPSDCLDDQTDDQARKTASSGDATYS